MPESGSVYDDLPANYGVLGIASQFHIFAKGTSKLNAHTNGNIASAIFEGEVNFGTNIHEGLVSNEIDYLESVKTINSSSEIPDNATRKTKFVVGVNNQFSSVDNGNGIALNGTKLDHLKNADIFQDKNKKYIDFSSEFNKLYATSDQLYSQKPNLTITNDSFDDPNKRVIDLASQTSSNVFVNIDASVLAGNTDLNINNPSNKIVIMNVTNSQSNLDIASKIVYNGRSNQETENFSDANISWNFGNDTHTINFNAPFQGTVLAPNSAIIVNQNLDGSIIATDVDIKAETHRWDPNPIILNGAVILKKVDSGDKNKTLAGAEFSLFAKDGTLIKAGLVTGEDGTLRYDNLTDGDYYFVETKAPEGYQLETSHHEFTIKSTETAEVETVTVSDEKITPVTGSVILTKVDSGDKNKTLAGAEFSLFAKDGTLIKAGLVTGEDGTLRYDNLTNGDYYFIETKAPKGYQLDASKHPFTINTDETTEAQSVTVSDKQNPGEVILKKVDSQDKSKTLAGAEFSLYKEDGTLIQSGLKTNKDGILEYDHLASDVDYFVETKAPEGYRLDKTRHAFKIKANQETDVEYITVTNVQKSPVTGSVILTKVDSGDKNKTLAGAEFSLFAKDGTLIKAGLVTGEDGILRYDNLTNGDYYFVETKAPKGYQLETSHHEFTIKSTETADVETVTVSDKKTSPVTGSVILKKVDSADKNKTLAGAEFSLFTKDGTLIKAGLVTGEDGTLRYDNLTDGDYYFVETKAPKGYQLETSHHEFTIKSTETADVETVTVSDEKTSPVTGSVILTKVDSADKNKTLAGAEFSLFAKDGTLIKAGLVTGQDGTLRYDKLTNGDYYFVETKAPKGYQLETSHHEFTIKSTETADVETVTVSDEKTSPVTGSVILTKVDSGDKNKTLAGAEFSLFAKDGTLIKVGLVTGEDGTLRYDNLTNGDYYFVETKAPKGYQLETSHHEFTIKSTETADVETVTVSDEKTSPVTGSVILTKVDSGDKNKTLAGAEFSLFAKDGTLIKAGLVTGQDGTLRYDKLTNGDYYFVETKAPKGYQLETSHHEFTIKSTETAEVETVTVSDEKITPVTGSVILTKVDSGDKNKTLAGAEFSLFAKDGTLIKAGLVTGQDGTLRYDKLTNGDYYFVETKAPKGYQLETSHHEFTIKSTETADVETVTVSDEKTSPVTGSVILTKVDSGDKNKTLAGAEFSLFAKDGTLIKAGLVTGEDGTLRYDNLTNGDYYFIETKAPKGYQLDASKHPFTINTDETTEAQSVTVSDKQNPGEVILKKVDSQDKSKTLAGAEFSLYKEDGTLIQSGLKTNKDGILEYDHLASDVDYFVETKAPEGYRLDKTRHAFKIKANQETDVEYITVTNVQKSPVTGSVILTKVDSGDKNKTLAGAEFSLFAKDGTLIKAGLVTGEDGILRYDNLTNGDYYFVETKAPKGHQLETSHHEFTIKSTETADIETVTVSDEKTDRLPDTGERTGLLITILGILTIVFSVLIFLNKNILSNNHI
ncbi:hypothetical protein RU87_GL000661 [Lactococcus plantarum]|uniref:SpaA-like prealbumin fold domain-containing protein n=1 Tax=Pseudolactococcus plantarum TaxID=1365 RepID=A0A2A5S368_9LACT|nr:hypothetical protein RU87_GL000661 [Lactococcus plantarum]